MKNNDKNKIIFLNFLPAIDSSYSNKGSIYPCTASLLIGTYLYKHGFEVQIIDGAYHQDYLEQLRDLLSEDVLYVGMTVMTSQIPFALEASKLIKDVCPLIKVVWGGPHPTLFPEQTLRNDNIDIVAINEGTFASLALAQAFVTNSPLHSIHGIGYKDQSGKIIFSEPACLDNLEELPYFDFSLIELDNYLNSPSSSVYQREFQSYKDKIRVLPILTALGCPYKCQFCFNVITKRKYRIRSAESIVSEIKHLMSQYNVNTFFFLDEDFFINKKRAFEFVDLVEKEGLHFNWRMWCRVDHFKEKYLDRNFIERLAAIGHGSLVMGGESANQEILDAINKRITPEQILHSLHTITGTRIMPRYSFMIGLENETMDQIKNTYRFCFELLKINPEVDIAGPFIFRLYPGSPIYDRIIKTHDLDIPKELEDWVVFLQNESCYTRMPWTPKKFQEIAHLLPFYSYFAFLRTSDMKLSIKGMSNYFIHQLSKFRIKHLLFKYPFEYWVFMRYLR